MSREGKAYDRKCGCCGKKSKSTRFTHGKCNSCYANEKMKAKVKLVIFVLSITFLVFFQKSVLWSFFRKVSGTQIHSMLNDILTQKQNI
jgi:reverse gyrase